MSTYGENAITYFDAGWTGVLPVPVAAKFPPPTGYTGTAGADTDTDTITRWAVEHAQDSLALRMPVLGDGTLVIGIDVDHYDKPTVAPDGTTTIVSKRGGDSLAEYENRWGPLPDTWRSSARPAPSGIRFYRVPNGKYATVLGESIEIIQRHHRYAVAPPSAHPGSGGVYTWHRPDGAVADPGEVPDPATLPLLPERWVAGLSEHVSQNRNAPGSSAQATTMLTALEADERAMCPVTAYAAARAVSALDGASGGSRHDTAMARTMRLVGLGAEGHTGTAEALALTRAAWDRVTAGEHREYEFDSLVSGAAAQAAGSVGSGTPRAIDPCEGGSGLGVELIAEATGRRSSVTLIVEGIDNARVCAEYAGPEVSVLGVAGRESWRRDGVPVPELRMVDGSVVVIVASAEVTRDLAAYTSAVDLGEACAGKGATMVGFAQPPGGAGASISAYLDVLDEPERAPALAYVVENPTAKPAKTKPKRRREPLGAATATGLIDPNDTALATDWSDGARMLWRWLLDTDRWMGYRGGRWETTSARAPYNDVARYCNDVAQQYIAAAQTAEDDGAKDLLDTARMLLSHNKITTVVARAAGHSDLHVRRDELDAHPRAWAAGNGTISLMDRTFGPHDPELLLTVGSEVIYDPAATCPRFDAFFADVLPDPEVRGYVLRLFGVAMLGEVRANAQVFTVLVGSGRNGKGALVRTMERVFGDMAVTVDPRTLQEAKFDGHSQEVAKLAGKRLATAQEPERGKGWNTGRIKSWTGGDRLTGRFMNQNDFDFTPSHTLIVTANDRPPVSRADSAFWMRYREVPFDVSVEGREDPTLEADIAEHELSGVLNRCLNGLADYLAHGLAEPSAVVAATHEAQAESDHLAVFVETHLVHTRDEADRLLTADVYDVARKWWSQNVRGEALPSDRGRNNFTVQMCRVLGLAEAERNPRKAKIDGSARLAWHGLRWLNGGGPEVGADIAPLRVAGTGNPPGAPIHDESSDLAKGADIGGQDADIKTDTATDLINVSPGHTASVADVADVADINGVEHSTGENVDVLGSNLRHADDTPKTDTCVSATPGAMGPARQLRNSEPFGDPNSLTCNDANTLDVSAGEGHRSGSWSTPDGPTVVFDLETASADQLHAYPDPVAYVRIAGHRVAGVVEVSTGPATVVEHVISSRKVIGHNVTAFDLPALARADRRIDPLAMARAGRVHDTMITESVLHPVLNDKRSGAVARAMKHFALDAVAARRGLVGKTDDLAALAKRHGGYDKIPTDDPEYRSYAAGDIEATTRLAAAQAAEVAALPSFRRDYLAREHRVHAIAATMGSAGFAVDAPLLHRRFWAGYGRKNDLSRSLIARYGIPTVKADGKPAESPAATLGGKRAILRALLELGVNSGDLPRTPKGKASFGGDGMRALAATYAGHPRAEEIAALTDVVADVNGVRTIYGTALEALCPDGRVHPSVATFQASGRWSVRNPGLTVFGKRGGKVIERAVFTATDSAHALFAIDLSQIDSRSIAVHSQDPDYLALFAPGLDAHEIVARMVWGDTAYDASRKTLRNRVKAITHGLPYGMGLEKLVESTGVPREDAQRVIDTMNERFPRLQEWKNEVREQASTGEPMDNGFGRLMLADADRSYTQGPALFGQSCARDAMMECLLRLPDDIARMLRAQVHDEAVFEIPRADADEVIRIVTAAFNWELFLPGLPLPVRIEAEAGHLSGTWSGCY